MPTQDLQDLFDAIRKFNDALDHGERLAAGLFVIEVVFQITPGIPGGFPFLPGFTDWNQSQATYEAAVNAMGEDDLEEWASATLAWMEAQG